MKPRWLVYFSRCFVISSFLNVSSILPTTKVRFTGWQFPGSSPVPFPRTGQAKWKQPRARIAKLLPLVLKKRHTRKTTNWHSLSFVSNKKSNRFPYKPNPPVLETASVSFPLSQLPHSILHSAPLHFRFSPYLVSYLSIPPSFSSEAAVPSIAGIFRVQRWLLGSFASSATAILWNTMKARWSLN